MSEYQKILSVILSLYLLLIFIWIRKYRWKRALLASSFRILWCMPILAAAFPSMRKEVISQALSLKTIHVLEDDSESMGDQLSVGQKRSSLAFLNEACAKLGCQLRISKLSELNEAVSKGFTPLLQSMKAWLPLTHGEPWILMSDGGDSLPSQPWPQSFGRQGLKGDNEKGLILSIGFEAQDNVWLESVSGADFGFEQKSMDMELMLHRRTRSMDSELTVQLQASSLDKNLTSMNVVFQPGDSTLSVRLKLPSLPRGTHLIKVTALPIAQEVSIWDNTVFKSVEILPNTIGLLHLLGSPGWDGRFVRRYLKSEPKYDLISFFILRDPNDVQLNNERDLSLIPFPVERLFNEELPNFRAVVIQNFSLSQFLEPTYQKNLVDFVLKGGGLLFIGGPRALKDMDINGSPLSELLPFKRQNKKSVERDEIWSESGSLPYDEKVPFRIKYADPKPEQRLLATVFDDYKSISFELGEGHAYQGLHRLDKVKLTEDGFTPLLTAEHSDGRESLLAAASYPGKGRALWIFSDSLWKLALNPASSREAYHNFLKSSMTWLLREEMQRPLWLQDLILDNVGSQLSWTVKVRGPSAKFLGDSQNWSYRLCGQKLTPSSIQKHMINSDQWILSGTLQSTFTSGFACELQIEGIHKAFGNVKSAIYGIIPESFTDKDLDGSWHRLESLASLTGAKLIDANDKSYIRELEGWLRRNTGTENSISQTDQWLYPDYYWLLKFWWAWLLFLGLPLEVLVRRWDVLVGNQGSGSQNKLQTNSRK